jgi:hypothetical protein
MFVQNTMLVRIAIISVGLVCWFSLILKDAAAFPLDLTANKSPNSCGEEAGMKQFLEGDATSTVRVVFPYLTKIQPLRQA